MMLRLATGRFAPAQFAALRDFAQARLAPTLSALSGFQSYTAAFDPASGQFLAVSVWETEAQARVADEATGRLRAEFAATHEGESAPPLSQPEGPLPRYYEVIAQA